MSASTPICTALAAVFLLACNNDAPLPQPPNGAKIERLDPALDTLVSPRARIEQLADGFAWSEGPVWNRRSAYLLFSDVPNNTIHRWKEGQPLGVHLRPAGYVGTTPFGRELGSNGLTGLNADESKELPFNGVYRISATGQLSLLTKELSFPNGIAFSPDEKTLYVSNSDVNHPVWMAYDGGRALFDATPLVKEGKKGLPDGMKVDHVGNIFAAGPGGILVLSPQGKHLGTIVTGQPTSNCAFGDDGYTLYITANNLVLRVRLLTKGEGF